MKKRAIFFFLPAIFLTGLSSAFASSYVIAPSANAATNGTTFTYLPFGETATTTMQVDIAASQLTALVGEDIDSIGFRLMAGSADVAAGTVIGNWNLELSSSLNPLGSLSAAYATNIAPNAETVYSGSLTLGALTGGGGLNTFFDIDFSTPYLYEGGDLLYTLVVSGGTNLGIGVDAVPVSSLVNTVGGSGSQKKQTQFFNVPVTEFGYSAPAVAVSSNAPEPSSLSLLLTGTCAAAVQMRRRFRRS